MGLYMKQEADEMVTSGDRFCGSGVGGTAHDRWGKMKMVAARGFSGEKLLLTSTRTLAHSLLKVWSRSERGETGGYRGVEVAAMVVGQSVRAEGRKEKEVLCMGAASL
jgi:hypothetical protein